MGQQNEEGPAIVFTDRLVGSSGEIPDVVDPNHPIDYSKQETPPNYKCGECGATGCKLWREYQTFLHHQTLRCAKCAAEDQGVDISDINDEGSYTLDPKVFGPNQRSDQIGWYTPAVPTEENDTYWGYTSVPEAGVKWWYNLPTFPV
jgi:hypothetical protein